MEKKTVHWTQKNASDDIKFSVETKKLARILAEALAFNQHESTGDAVLKALWEKAQRNIHPANLELVLSINGVSDKELDKCGLSHDSVK